MASRTFQGPTGTRDLYPLELARRRWIEHRWRRVSIRHGFEEVDGPTFEPTELYTVKSGEGIVSEIFGVFSGKDEAAVRAMGQRLARGEAAPAPYALRPEFTPTLARLYAARAAQLPRPTKWFWQQHCYRAERPQRGRLREFMQWNCDVIGDATPLSDAEVIGVCAGLLRDVGLTPADVRIRYNHRGALAAILASLGIGEDQMSTAFVLLDRRDRLDNDALEAMAFEFGITAFDFLQFLKRPRGEQTVEAVLDALPDPARGAASTAGQVLKAAGDELAREGVAEWCQPDFNIVRGLAYYTGLVFEVIVDGERAVAGGGRYDNLIGLFGGPPTPAVGFGMGDVVLALVLQDKGLMPSDEHIARELGLRPDVYVLSNGTPGADDLVGPTLAALRTRGLHARRSYKSTRNIGKLLREASDSAARYAVIIESPDEVTLKDLDSGTQERGPRAVLLERITPP